MYIYDSHLGNFYASPKKLSNESLYCETCGDYDSFIGEANTAQEAWELLKPNTREQVCDVCKNPICEELNYNQECPREKDCFAKWDYGFVAEFITKTFGDTIKNPIQLVLVAKNKSCENSIFVKSKRYDETIKYSLLTIPTLDENITYHVENLTCALDEYVCGSLKMIGTVNIGSDKYLFFEALDATGYDVFDKAHYFEDSWVECVSFEEALEGLSAKEKEVLRAYRILINKESR